MVHQARIAEIVTFLEEAKRLVSAGKYDFVPKLVYDPRRKR